MDFSNATSALRTLKLRPKAQQGAIEVSQTLLRLLSPQESENTENQTQNGTELPPINTLEQDLVRLLQYGKERWEPLAVFCAVCRDLLEIETSHKDVKVPRLSSTFLTTTVRDVVRQYYEHYEPRVRRNVAKLVGALAHWNLSWVSTEFIPLLVESVQCFLTRSPDFEETGFEEELDDNISLNGMESPTNSSVRGTPRTPSTPHRLDDVTGWKALESSLSAFKYIIRASGEAFLETKEDAFVYFTPEIQELVTTKAVFHVNRYVRVVGLDIITCLCTIAPKTFLSIHSDLSQRLCTCIVRGLQDNWSQVRYAASIAVRSFLLQLAPEQENEYYNQLLPRLCLNRYYVAERVQKHSQETWELIMGTRGRAIVAQHVDAVVAYYIEMTNHCVREAACHCIAELATKIDHEAVRPHVPALLDALLYSFRDNSWLVRDAACLASSQFVVAFPEESRGVLEILYTLWIDHLSDEIWSVREDAAIALGNVIRAYGEEMLVRITGVAESFITMAKEKQPAMCQHEYDELQRSVHAHKSKQAFSCCSLEPKVDERHHSDRVKQPWEYTDGAIYLIRELCSVSSSSDRVLQLLPMVADVAILRHFPQCATLQETVWKQVPRICEALGKRVFKQYLELFLDPLVFTLQGSSRLASFAARDCVVQLSQQIGPNIFKGRLQANATWVEIIGPIVPSSF